VFDFHCLPGIQLHSAVPGDNENLVRIEVLGRLDREILSTTSALVVICGCKHLRR
jgi:hypothetical protein